MLEFVAKVVLVAFVFGALWWALQPRYAFMIRIENGMPRVTKGHVTAAFLQEIGQACAEMEIMHGWIGGVQRGRRLALTFSRSLPPPCQQRLRNLWTLHG